MIAEIVSNGTLSLPSALATIGAVPGVIIIAFLGVFATYTAWLLVRFKLNHPAVHNMGDAGYVLFGVFGRELLSFGTLAFAIFGTGSELVAGAQALSVLSDNKLCSMLYTGIFAVATLVCSLSRTLDRISFLAIFSCGCILVATVVGMVGAGLNPASNRQFTVAQSSSFYGAFSSVTNPVFALAGHFAFFSLMSEMKKPHDAMKSAYVLQGSATSLYIVFATVTYYYLGSDVASPSFSSLPPKWAKASFGISLPNFLIAGAIYIHIAAKIIFVRMFRHSRHLHDNTVIGWGMWVALIILLNGVAFVLAVGIPIFNLVVGLAASLFAAWFTYGLAGGFWLFDAWHGMPYARRKQIHDVETKSDAVSRHPVQATLAIATILAGAFICVAGLYVTIRGIVDAYNTGKS